MGKNVLELKNISKIYENGIIANKNINFKIDEGDIHALVGENGAGKSTLMKIIFGMEKPTSGEFYLYGQPNEFDDVQQAIDKGIGMVHQHFMLVDSLDVVDNIMLGIEKTNGVFLDKKESTKIVKEISEKYNFNLDYEKKVSELSIGMKQKVEIIKTLVRGAKVIIFDEPTAVLTPQETEELFLQIKKLSKNGHTIIFISHKLNEVKEISNKVTIIRKGTTLGTYLTKEVEVSDIANLMIGSKVNMEVPSKIPVKGREILKVNNLNLKNENKSILKNINLEVRSGEIVGIIGVEGNGQSELVKILTLQLKDYEGKISIFGENLSSLETEDIRNMSVSYIPEDRISVGVSETLSIAKNLISTTYNNSELSGRVLLNKSFITKLSLNLIEDFNIVAESHEDIVAYLSGGNIQKVVVARESYVKPKLMICEQPTRGVDIGSANLIHNKIIDLRNEGTGILLISADINEILKISDRCLIIYNGKIVAKINELDNVDISEVGEYMLGLKVKL